MLPEIGGVRTPGLFYFIHHYPWLAVAVLVVIVAVVYYRNQR